MNIPNTEAVLHLVNGTLNKYVPASSHRLIQADLIIGIRQFKNSVGWKEFWLKYEVGSETDSKGVMEEEEKIDEDGLNLVLRPSSSNFSSSSITPSEYISLPFFIL